jgi:hypothetical protein
VAICLAHLAAETSDLRCAQLILCGQWPSQTLYIAAAFFGLLGVLRLLAVRIDPAVRRVQYRIAPFLIRLRYKRRAFIATFRCACQLSPLRLEANEAKDQQ